MSRIPELFLNAIALFYPDEQTATENRRAHGTGFFITLAHEGGRTFLVTNNQLIQRGCTTVRRDLPTGQFKLAKIEAEAWEFHLEWDDIAVTAVPHELFGGPVKGIPWEPVATMEEHLKELDVGVGSEVFLLERFMPHANRGPNQSGARFGNISLMPGETILDSRNVAVQAFLVEMRSRAGANGAPVFVRVASGTARGNGSILPFFRDQIRLIGLSAGPIEHRHEANADLESYVPLDEWYVAQSQGLSIVSPAWRVQEVLNFLL